ASTLTDSTGYFNLSVNFGSHIVVASKEGYISDSSEVDISKDKTTAFVTFRLSPLKDYACIRGTVYDKKTDDPIWNAEVSAGYTSTVTHWFGQYELKVPPGSYTVTASADRYESQSKKVKVEAGQTVTVNFELSPSEYKGYIEGYVYHFYNNHWVPLEGATVATDEGSTTTDSSGYYKIDVSYGKHEVVASKSGSNYITEKATVYVSLDKGFAKQNFYLSLPGYIEGTVYRCSCDGDCDEPIPGVKISTATASDPGVTTYTDSQGRYHITVGAGYTIVVQASKKGYKSEREAVKVEPHQTVVLNFKLSPGEDPQEGSGHMSGHVYDAETGEPIKYASISVWGFYCGHTDESGYYSVEFPYGVGTYIASASAGGYYPDNETIYNDGHTTIHQDFYLQPRKENSSCFLAGTKIEMADGSLKSIEDIKVGDLVKSYDIESKEWKVGIVTKVFHHSPEEMGDYYLIINNELRVTPNHPVYLNGKWMTAGELKVGDVFGEKIVSIERIYRKVPTYNFEVYPYHNYKVVWGQYAQCIAHNANADGPIDAEEWHDWHDDYTCLDKA
ncbi:MAG: hypothetical protein DRN25_05760, partial [Thermoplasmata archaeon]